MVWGNQLYAIRRAKPDLTHHLCPILYETRRSRLLRPIRTSNFRTFPSTPSYRRGPCRDPRLACSPASRSIQGPEHAQFTIATDLLIGELDQSKWNRLARVVRNRLFGQFPRAPTQLRDQSKALGRGSADAPVTRLIAPQWNDSHCHPPAIGLHPSKSKQRMIAGESGLMSVSPLPYAVVRCKQDGIP